MHIRSWMIGMALLAGSAGLTAGSVAAQGRPSSVAMSCGQTAGLVRARGAVVIGTGGQTYDRYVASRQFCEATEEVRPAYVATRDSGACFVGYTCFEPSARDRFRF